MVPPLHSSSKSYFIQIYIQIQINLDRMISTDFPVQQIFMKFWKTLSSKEILTLLKIS